MTIILTGGGTAGHINPALAIAETFRENDPRTQIYFAGTAGGMERRLATEAGYPFLPVSAMGFSRSLSPANLKALYLALRGPREAAKLLRKLKPELVVGTGGYVAWPMLRAAAALGIPTALHESNAAPGLTVRRLAKKTDLVLLNFKETAEKLPPAVRTFHVGNPLRRGFCTLTREQARRRLRLPSDGRVILSFGGSLGASVLNRAVLDLMQDYSLSRPEVYHIHGCGTRYYDAFSAEFQSRFREPPARFRIADYLKDIPTLMAACDLLICRCGAVTLSEAAMAERAAILIPSPNVAENHQYHNGLAVEQAGAGILLEESKLSRRVLTEAVRSVLETPGKQAEMEKAAARLGIRDANRRIYTALYELVKEKSSPRGK